ncbi:hypothetical protein [Corynebacterium halotolerans]|uniref:hypothetical protein n=1 Tax=Corynebacterium halotolerans TaxID=225326 RepID=UPI0003453936|nr:hypothetical protein [Corynebacterium halotolerans]
MYIPSISLAGIEDWEHYRYRSLALGHHHGKILGGLSAAAVHGLWLVDSAPSELEFYRPHGDRVGRGLGYRQLHGRLPPQHVSEIAGIRVTSIARTIVDLGRYHGFSAAFVALSAALAHNKCNRSDVLRITEKLNLHGTKELPRILERAAGNLDSALEAIFHAQVVYYGDFDVIPQLRVVVDGRTYFLDFAVKGTHESVECDGMEKYGQSPAEQKNKLRKQKRRADDLTRTGITSNHFTYREVVTGHAYRTMLRRLGLPDRPNLPAIYLP